MTSQDIKISVVINTFNSEEFLDIVLNSLKGFDEIVICDMHSTDKTIEIAKKHNCKIVYHAQTGGIVEPARAYAVSQTSYKWVFIVDSDEVVTPQLKDFLYSVPSSDSKISGVKIPRKNYFMGKFMHCAYPDYILRFVNKDNAVFSNVIHSTPKIDGEVYTIDKKHTELAFIHLANEPIKLTISKMNTYTEFELKRRKDKKYNVLSLIFEPLVRFLRFYVFKMGFRDGLPGLIWAVTYANYKFFTIAKVMELRKRREKIDPELKKHLGEK